MVIKEAIKLSTTCVHIFYLLTKYCFAGSTNKEFNYRHDWNSLISNNESLKMYHYSDDYFPNADIYVSTLLQLLCVIHVIKLV